VGDAPIARDDTHVARGRGVDHVDAAVRRRRDVVGVGVRTADIGEPFAVGGVVPDSVCHGLDEVKRSVRRHVDPAWLTHTDQGRLGARLRVDPRDAVVHGVADENRSVGFDRNPMGPLRPPATGGLPRRWSCVSVV
jgi:hypothetical protein